MTTKEFKELKPGDKIQYINLLGKARTIIFNDNADKRPAGYYTYTHYGFGGKKGNTYKKYESNAIFIGAALYPAKDIKVVKVWNKSEILWKSD